MVLEKLRNTTASQRFKRVILGKERPNLLTRVSVITAFIAWLYLFSWQILTFLSIILLDNLDQSDYVKAVYVRVGNVYGNNITNKLFVHSACQIGLYLIILFGLILIWRKKKLGFLIYVIGNLVSFLLTFVLMGFYYLVNEIPIFDFILIGGLTLYFSIGLFIFYRKNKTESDLSDH